MKQLTTMMVMAFVFVATATAQDKFFTKSGKISFYSKAPLENIEAHNKSITTVLDIKTGALQFAVLIKGFEFQKALMQEHFNENYLESSKFPRSEFKGSIVNNSEINYTKDGIYPAKVQGKLTIHGETKDIEATGKIIVKGNSIATNADFVIQLNDYKIKIPGLVKDKVSNTVTIQVACALEPLKG